MKKKAVLLVYVSHEAKKWIASRAQAESRTLSAVVERLVEAARKSKFREPSQRQAHAPVYDER